MASEPFPSEFGSDSNRSDEERFPEVFRQGPMADRHKATRIVPMRVLVFGLPRTGTSSIKVALSRMDFNNIYHFRSVIHDPDDAQWWLRAGDAKWNRRGKFTKENWDQLLGHCQAVCDLPSAAFADELIASYPEAKVVILNRDVDKWYISMTQTILKVASPNAWSVLRDLLDWRELGQVWKMLGQQMYNMFGSRPGGMSESNMKASFIEYHEHIRRIVPRERLLEFKVQDGYKPLCDFLGVPVPTTVIGEKEVEEPFPRVNEGAAFHDRVKALRRCQNRRILKKIGKLVSAVVLVGVGLWYLRR
ncbi:hypothetical protein EPUS_08419 [Endocarpon pusillum Z07020]|uniref:Sulfotransferase domain-containing protein n=1 Tax=Endocarpon pusillum (strain Z07020 / HMAS-L-300199) TaxID=1263415 RepID=U1HNS1_ENDPU|nr:uncharacterized protein EPUS_08419 [Endocarpon pusillum Z07020]ERF72025.1 hypothetical protein EPUS_08419 [Endocarpon pusillum Z07020]